MKIKIKAGDILVYIFIIVMIAGSFIGLRNMKSVSSERMLVIEIDGKIKGIYEYNDLSEEDKITIDAGKGRFNTIGYENGRIFIHEANCPDQICVKSGKIHSPGQTIVCLPHKVVVRISGKKEDNRDDNIDDIAS